MIGQSNAGERRSAYLAGTRRVLGRATITLGRRLGRSPSCRPALRWVRRFLERAAAVPVIGVLFERLVEAMVRTSGSETASVCSLSDVLQIAGSLERTNIAYWLAGGWGVDALVGTQLRYHGDLDLVVDDLAGRSDAIAAALAPLGFEPRGNRETGTWWLPEGADFDRPEGPAIEVLEVNWDLLASIRSVVDVDLDPPVLRAKLRSTCLGTGRLGPRALPCLSLPAQLLFHQGYAQGPTDRHDLGVLRDLGGEPSVAAGGRATSLIIPMFELDATLRQIWTRLNPGKTALPPHLTVITPFLPGEQLTTDVLAGLQELLRRFEPFHFELSATGWFDERVLYLAPSPALPFLSMTEKVMEAYPSVSPYGGEFANITPHLTLGEDVPVAHLRRVAARASRRLPVHGEATEVWLIALGSDGWSLLHRFRLMGIGVAEAPSSLAISGGRSPLHSLPTPVNTSFGGRGG